MKTPVSVSVTAFVLDFTIAPVLALVRRLTGLRFAELHCLRNHCHCRYRRNGCKVGA